MSTEFVNIHGQPWKPSAEAITNHLRPRKETPEKFHKGWQVKGIPPGALEQAETEHGIARRAAEVAVRDGSPGARLLPDWDADKWLRNARLKAVRSKPYSIPDAANVCADLAHKGGWLRVEVVELKSEK